MKPRAGERMSADGASHNSTGSERAHERKAPFAAAQAEKGSPLRAASIAGPDRLLVGVRRDVGVVIAVHLAVTDGGNPERDRLALLLGPLLIGRVERRAHLVHAVGAAGRVPDIASVGIGGVHLLHVETVLRDGAVGDQLVEDRLLVLLPELPPIV